MDKNFYKSLFKTPLKNMYKQLEFEDIIKEMLSIQKTLTVDNNILKKFNKTNINPSLLKSRFMPKHISDFIIKNLDFYNIDLDDIIMTVSFEKNQKPFLDETLKKAIIRSKLMYHYYDGDKKKDKLIIYLFRTPFKKKIRCSEIGIGTKSKKNIILGVDNVNSGYTDYRTVVYREEEILKVLVHELLHQLDIGNPHFCYNLDTVSFLINETFVEINALILNVLFTILENEKYLNNMKQSFVNLMLTEMDFSLNQVHKILDIYGLTDKDKIDTVLIKKRSDASVSEYYVYKTGILFLTDELTKFLKQDKLDQNFINLCEKSLVNLKKILDQTYFDKICLKPDEEISLRMTIVE